MSKIKLPHASGNSMSIAAPATIGTAGQALVNSSTPGTLEFGTVGKFVSCAFIADKKSQNTDGGSSTAGSHVQRDLNHEFYDPDGIVSISSNQFTLAAGTYIIEWSAPSYHSNQHASRLREVTDGTIQEGTAEYSNDYAQTRSVGSARVTQTGSKTYRIEHKVAEAKDTNGWGVATSNTANYDVYTWVKIYKEA
jgi:hypothetical protein